MADPVGTGASGSTNPARDDSSRSSRRDVLRRAGGAVVAGGVAYTAPHVLSMPVAAAQSAGGTTTTTTCTNCSRQSNVARTATMSAGAPYDPVRYARWHNKTYEWNAKFDCAVDNQACAITITIRVHFAAATAQAQMSQDVANAWNTSANTFHAVPNPTVCLCQCYSIQVVLQFVAANGNPHYVIQSTGTDPTLNMTNWNPGGGDIAHEVGHMLGCPDEYFHVGIPPGAQVDRGVPRNPAAGAGIMNNPDQGPLSRHYDTILAEATACLNRGVTLTTGNGNCS